MRVYAFMIYDKSKNNSSNDIFQSFVLPKCCYEPTYFTAGELQNTKLAALQKVLQSDFCGAVREVYEHVYETVDISGSPEVRANATAKVLTL